MVNYHAAWVQFENNNEMFLDMFVRPKMLLRTLIELSNSRFCKSSQIKIRGSRNY